MWQRGDDILVYNPFYFYKYKPYIINQMHGYPDKLGTDQYGFIYNFDIDRTIDEKNINIFLMGGSTVEGRGSSSNSKTIPSLLESCLKEKYRQKINVINSGYSGYTVLQQINFYNYYIKENFKKSVNFIIFFDGFNDAYYTITNKGIGIEGVNHHIYRSYFKDKQTLKFKLNSFFSNFSGTYLSVSKIFINQNNKNKISLHKDKISDNTKNLSKKIDEFKLSLNKENIGFVHIIQPYLSSSNKKITSKEQILINNYLKRMKLNQKEYFNHLDNFFNKYIFSNNNSLDYSKIFINNKNNLYYDTVHYNDHGNKIISEKICNDFPLIFELESYKG